MWVVSFMSQCFIPGERVPSTHWIGEWVGPTTVLESRAKKKIVDATGTQTLTTLVIQPIVHRSAECAIMASLISSCSKIVSGNCTTVARLDVFSSQFYYLGYLNVVNRYMLLFVNLWLYTLSTCFLKFISKYCGIQHC
jgi:hypothetical protein